MSRTNLQIHIYILIGYHNMLKLNDDKAEFIVIGTRQQRSKIDIPHMEPTLHQLILFVT